MPTARELLEQADALMRRNRAGHVDTTIPELTEAIPMPAVAAGAPAPTPAVALDDIPELTDAVEEIEIASIAEIPDQDVDSNGWLGSDEDELAAEVVTPPEPSAATPSRVPEPIGGRVLPLFAIAGKPHESAVASPEAAPASIAEGDRVVDAMSGSALVKAPVVELPMRDAPSAQDDEVTSQSIDVASPEATPHDIAAKTPAANDWARWEAIAEEIRMQVLQRIDIFIDTGLREELDAQMQPIVERASAEMVATINAQIGTLLRAYIAEAIEREIEKWRESNP